MDDWEIDYKEKTATIGEHIAAEIEEIDSFKDLRVPSFGFIRLESERKFEAKIVYISDFLKEELELKDVQGRADFFSEFASKLGDQFDQEEWDNVR